MFNLSLKARFPSDISRITSTTTRTQGKKPQFQNALHTVALFTRFAQCTAYVLFTRCTPCVPSTCVSNSTAVHSFAFLFPTMFKKKNCSDLKIMRHEVVNFLSKLPNCLYLSYSCTMYIKDNSDQAK